MMIKDCAGNPTVSDYLDRIRKVIPKHGSWNLRAIKTRPAALRRLPKWLALEFPELAEDPLRPPLDACVEYCRARLPKVIGERLLYLAILAALLVVILFIDNREIERLLLLGIVATGILHAHVRRSLGKKDSTTLAGIDTLLDGGTGTTLLCKRDLFLVEYVAFHLRNTNPRYITVGSLALLATVIYVLLVRDGFSGYEAFIMVAAIGSCALLCVRYLAGYSAVMVLSKMTRAQDEVGHESRITASEEIALRICLVPLAIAIVCTAGIAALISVSDMEERVASIPLALCVVLCYSKFVLLGRKAVLYRIRQQLANLSGGERE